MVVTTSPSNPERQKGAAMKKYRPSNGTEGEIFMCEFCYQCIHEKWSHTQNDDDKKCEIITLTMGLDVDDKDYPSEWTFDAEGNPTCTKFQKWDWGNNGDPDDPDNPNKPPDPPDPNQLNLFPLYPKETDFQHELKRQMA
jgi:hypothetical protein